MSEQNPPPPFQPPQGPVFGTPFQPPGSGAPPPFGGGGGGAGGAGGGGTPPGPNSGAPAPGTSAARDLAPERLLVVTFAHVRTILKATFVPAALIAVVSALPAAIFGGVASYSVDSDWVTKLFNGDSVATGIMVIVGIIVVAVAYMVWAFIQSGALVFLGGEALSGRTATVGQALQVGMKKIGTVFGASFISGFFILIGILLCCLPGIYAGVVLWVAVPAAVLEAHSSTGAVTRSRNLTRGIFWSVLLNGVIFAVACAAIVIPFACATGAMTAAGAFLNAGKPEEALASMATPHIAVVIVQQVLSFVQTVLLTVFAQSWSTALFWRLREVREPQHNAGIAAVFT